MWTYDMTKYLMVEFEILIALTTMIYIVETNLSELHPMNDKLFDDFNNDEWICLAKNILAIFSTWYFGVYI